MDAEFFDTDICNAIYELKHIAKSGKLEITPAIIALCNAEVTPVDARDILMKNGEWLPKNTCLIFSFIRRH